MKVLQLKYTIILFLFVSLMGSTLVIGIPNSFGQEDIQIPDWIKNVVDWWTNDEISEREFLFAIEYLINNNIILLDFIPCNYEVENKTMSSSKLVPVWIKNNGSWWLENLIEDIDFLNGIKYLVQNNIIEIDNKKILGKVPFDDIIFSGAWEFDENSMVFVKSSFFEVYAHDGDCVMSDGKPIWQSLILGLDPNKVELYNQVAIYDSSKTVVVYPYFTYSAYHEPGFYTYYRGECDECTTTKFAHPIPLYTSSGIGHQALSLLGYSTMTDIEIDRNPDLLEQFDKVIMLHNEYVTRTMFDAITNHPNVIYLYPNALYAEIEVDYINETITLIRGHDYPPEDPVKNGFDWEFDNTHPYEYDTTCLDMKFYKIKNGWMTNCYPENLFIESNTILFNLLKTIKDL